MIEALSFTRASHELVTPKLSEGLPQGLVLQVWIRRTSEGARQPIVELAGSTTRIVLGTGERGDMISLAVIRGNQTKEIAAEGALPLGRWVQVRAILRPDSSAELRVLGFKLAQGKLAAPGSEQRVATIGGGFIGELAQLQIWKHQAPTVLSYDPPDLAAPNLWAYYPLARVEASDGRIISEDAGPNHRHAKAPTSATDSDVPVRVEHDEPLDHGRATYLRFGPYGTGGTVLTPKLESASPGIRLSPLTGLHGQLTLEAWVRPSDDPNPMPMIQLQAGETRLVLTAGGSQGDLTLMAIKGEAAVVLARAPERARADQWSHVAVTLRAGSEPGGSLELALYQQGRRRAREQLEVGKTANPEHVLALIELLHGSLVPEVSLGGAAPGLAPFAGGLAEVRIWSAVAPDQLAATWLTRACGDEAGLIGCYRLDDDPSQPLVDLSRRRGVGKALGGVYSTDSEHVPLSPTAGALAFRIRARGKLIREWLPKPKSVGSTKINLTLTNTNTGETSQPRNVGEERRVFDATIEVQPRSGNSPLGRTLELRLDQPLTMLEAQDGQLTTRVWAADRIHQVPLPASGRVRLRFAAQQLACPTLRVRVAGAPGGVWTSVRPDERVQARLRGLTVASLKSPSAGRRSPLPPATSDEDTSALVDAIRKLATQFPQRNRTTSAQTKPEIVTTSKFLGGVGDWVEDTAGDAVDWTEDTIDDAVDGTEDAIDETVDWTEGAVDDTVDWVEDTAGDAGDFIVATSDAALAGATVATKSAAKLLVQGTAEVEALARKAASATAMTGSAALATAIAGADQLAILVTETASKTARWIEVVGTTIVDGSTVVWRAIVAGVEDALTAIEG